jgi:sulfotransferase
MDNGINFISGLPRSGSTLLAAILRQNPRFHAGIASPIGFLFNGLMRQMSQENEAAAFIDDEQRHRVLAGVFDNYYFREHPRHVVFDTNRLWSAKLAALARLFPKSRMICCVRQMPWIVDSLEQLARRNALEPSKIFAFDANSTVYTRYDMLTAANGLLGYAWNALREAFYGPNGGQLMLLTYETLSGDPRRAFQAIYEFIGEPAFGHDFSNISPALDTTDFDRQLGAPGLHALRPVVAFQPRETVLPPDLFQRVARSSFWLDPAANPRRILVV